MSYRPLNERELMKIAKGLVDHCKKDFEEDGEYLKFSPRHLKIFLAGSLTTHYPANVLIHLPYLIECLREVCGYDPHGIITSAEVLLNDNANFQL